MDSLDRLSHSIEAAAALIHSLRRENRELAHAVSLSASKAALEEALAEIERMRQEPKVDVEAQDRARLAELEAAGLAEKVDEEKKNSEEQRRELTQKIQELELKLLASQREEIMPLPDRSQEIENLSRRCAELEVMLAEAQEALEKGKGHITAMQVRIAESADPEEVSAWQQKIHALRTELEGLKALEGMKNRLEADRNDVKRQKRTLAAIALEREMTRRKLEEIYGMLDNLRLS